MPLVIGARLGSYEVVAPLGAGGSACGHAKPRPPDAAASLSVSSRRGWGPASFPVAENVALNPGQATSNFSASATGVLAYWTGAGVIPVQLTWVDRNGRRLGDLGLPSEYRGVALSPLARSCLTPSPKTVNAFSSPPPRGTPKPRQ